MRLWRFDVQRSSSGLARATHGATRASDQEVAANFKRSIIEVGSKNGMRIFFQNIDTGKWAKVHSDLRRLRGGCAGFSGAMINSSLDRLSASFMVHLRQV
jgi:hypothetical protein